MRSWLIMVVVNNSHGQPGTSNTAEGALWAIDWMLQLASMGIERMHFHHGVGFRYNFFQPVATDAEHDDGLNMTQRAHILRCRDQYRKR